MSGRRSSRAGWKSAAALGSSAEVASSSSRMSGSCSSIRARTRRCFWPPESTSRQGRPWWSAWSRSRMKPPRPARESTSATASVSKSAAAVGIGRRAPCSVRWSGRSASCGGEEDPGAGGRAPTPPLAVGPEAGEGLEQRALAAAARAADVDPVAAAEDEARHGDEGQGVVAAVAEARAPRRRQHRAGERSRAGRRCCCRSRRRSGRGRAPARPRRRARSGGAALARRTAISVMTLVNHEAPPMSSAVSSELAT